MTRRDALKTFAGTLAAFVLPASRPRIDLMAFCGRYFLRYEMRLPHEVNDWTYATDGHVCVRVRPSVTDRVESHGKAPPFHTLTWNHDQLRGWRTLPRLQPILAADSDCPQCDGTGYSPGITCTECEACDGLGDVWVNSNYDDGRRRPCQDCGGLGHVPPAGTPECSNCHGKAVGVFPSVVKLDDSYYDAVLYEKVQALGGEFVTDYLHARKAFPMLRFTFDGGSGLLMAIKGPLVEKRVARAR